MKILVVCQYYYPEPFRITDICESLVENGHEVTVLTGLPNYPDGIIYERYRRGRIRDEKINGVKVIRCFEVGRGRGKFKLFINYISFSISASIKSLFIKNSHDVVLVNQLSPILMAIPALFYKKKHNKKVVLYCLDLWPDSLAAGGIKETSIIYKIFKWISKSIYASVDSILVSSNMFKEYFRDVLKMEVENVNYLPQYAENIFLNNVKYEDDKKLNLVFAGNIGDMQSVDTIIKAANELRDQKNIVFHIIGDGSKLEECKNTCKKYELQNIKFYGRLPLTEMPKIYEMADAMLITLKDNINISYTLPGKVQSYMAAGKPIIGAINGETNQVITQAKCGMVCSAEDYIGLSNLIKKFCDSDFDIRRKMGLNSHEYYINNFSKKRFMLNLQKKLEEMRGI